MTRKIFSGRLKCFHNQNSYLDNFKCNTRATQKCLVGCMWPAGQTLPKPGLIGREANRLTLGTNT